MPYRRRGHASARSLLLSFSPLAQAGCHGDCKGPGAATVLEDIDLGGGVIFPKQGALARRARIYEMAMELFEQVA